MRLYKYVNPWFSLTIIGYELWALWFLNSYQTNAIIANAFAQFGKTLLFSIKNDKKIPIISDQIEMKAISEYSLQIPGNHHLKRTLTGFKSLIFY